MSRETLRAVMDVADEGWVHDIEASGRVAYDHARALLAVADAVAKAAEWSGTGRARGESKVRVLYIDDWNAIVAALAALEEMP